MHIGFSILKAIPLLLVFIAAFFLFDFSNIASTSIEPFGIIQNMPTILFAYIGIEACCAITHTIQNGKKNSAKAMLTSMGLIIAIYAIVQFGLLGIHGINSTDPFVDVISKLTTNPLTIKWGGLVINFAILSSFLGGYYGMFYANNWNLYAIAKEKQILFSKSLIKLNKHSMPWTCVFTQGIIVITFLLFAHNITGLMTMSGFGVVIAYILSAISYFKIDNKQLASKLAMVSCTLLLIACIYELANDGMQYFLPVLGMLLSGIILYFFSLSD